MFSSISVTYVHEMYCFIFHCVITTSFIYDNQHIFIFCLLIFITYDILTLNDRKHHIVIIIYSRVILDHSVKWHFFVQSYKSLGVLYSNNITHILSHLWKYITSKIAKINLSEVRTLRKHKSHCGISPLCQPKLAKHNRGPHIGK